MRSKSSVRSSQQDREREREKRVGGSSTSSCMAVTMKKLENIIFLNSKSAGLASFVSSPKKTETGAKSCERVTRNLP